jgi:hypothetical protein
MVRSERHCQQQGRRAEILQIALVNRSPIAGRRISFPEPWRKLDVSRLWSAFAIRLSAVFDAPTVR